MDLICGYTTVPFHGLTDEFVGSAGPNFFSQLSKVITWLGIVLDAEQNRFFIRGAYVSFGRSLS